MAVDPCHCAQYRCGFEMPLCDGRALGPGAVQPCPDRRNYSTVRLRQGDVMHAATTAFHRLRHCRPHMSPSLCL